jgi:hypothetical protein
MTESKLYQRHIKSLLTKQGYYFYRVEHSLLPDIYCCKNNIVTWIELKVINKRQKETLKPDWRPGQLAWIREHSMFGNNNDNAILLCLWYINKFYFLYPKEEYYLGELQNPINFK